MILKFRNLLWDFVKCMFVGMIIFSIGIGVAIPAIHRVAAPFVCSNGQMETEQFHYSYKPGQSGTTLSWLCVDGKTGEVKDVSYQAILVAGVIYGVVFFILYVIAAQILVLTVFKNSGRMGTHARGSSSFVKLGLEEAEKKLEKLKELYAADLITDEEYTREKQKILEKM